MNRFLWDFGAVGYWSLGDGGMSDRTVGLPEAALGQNVFYLKLGLVWQLVGGQRPP